MTRQILYCARNMGGFIGNSPTCGSWRRNWDTMQRTGLYRSAGTGAVVLAVPGHDPANGAVVLAVPRHNA